MDTLINNLINQNQAQIKIITTLIDVIEKQKNKIDVKTLIKLLKQTEIKIKILNHKLLIKPNDEDDDDDD